MAQTAEAVKPIVRDALNDKIDRQESLVLLETLSPEHFGHAHLPGAKNASTRNGSVDAARELTALGYTNVRSYAGNKQEWVSASLPVERGASAHGKGRSRS